MKIYCPRCGTGDQEPESYCRNCGEFLLDYSARSILLSKLLGGSNPKTQITVNLVLNLISIFTSFLLLGFLNGHYDALRERTGEMPPSVIYLVYAFLVVISIWQLFSIVVGLRLRSKLGHKTTGQFADVAARENIPGRETNELPPASRDYDTVPLTAAEDSTRILENVKRK